jgi:hypothetical protein
MAINLIGTVDTTDPAYQAMLADFTAIRTYIRPYLRHYYRLPPPKRKAWRQQDELLRGILKLSQRIARMEDDDGS